MQSSFAMRGNIPPLVASAAGLLPLLPLEVIARRLMANAMAARPSFVERLGEGVGRTFAIDPVDCPFVFMITPEGGRTDLKVVRRSLAQVCDARIAAPLRRDGKADEGRSQRFDLPVMMRRNA